MKILIALVLSTVTGAVLAAEPSYACKQEQGCMAIEGPTYDIGRGATISLSPGWKFFSYPTAPVPVMAGLREIRAFKDGVVIAITPFPNIDHRVVSEPFLCDIVTKSSGKYVDMSKEKGIGVMPMSHDDVVGCLASFTAEQEGEKPFSVFPNRRHASVTSFAISYKYVIFSVNVVSETQPDEGYLSAVNAIRQLR